MRCTDCYGTGKITCPVCKGSTKDPRNTAKDCSYCGGEGKMCIRDRSYTAEKINKFSFGFV